MASLDEDIQIKEVLKYDFQLEQAITTWLESIFSISLTPLQDSLKDGVILCKFVFSLRFSLFPFFFWLELCNPNISLQFFTLETNLLINLNIFNGIYRLMNEMYPESIKTINENTTNPFKHRENINNFLQACKSQAKIPDSSLFNTVDLYEAKNMNQVLYNIQILSKQTKNIKTWNHTNLEYSNLKSSSSTGSSSIYSENNPSSLLNSQNTQNYGELDDKLTDEDKNEILQWVNEIILSKNYKRIEMEEIGTVFRNGVVIIDLLECLTMQKISNKNTECSIGWQYLQNVVILLQFISQYFGERCNNISPQDIVRGDVPSTFRLLALIKSRFLSRPTLLSCLFLLLLLLPLLFHFISSFPFFPLFYFLFPPFSYFSPSFPFSFHLLSSFFSFACF